MRVLSAVATGDDLLLAVLGLALVHAPVESIKLLLVQTLAGMGDAVPTKRTGLRAIGFLAFPRGLAELVEFSIA